MMGVKMAPARRLARRKPGRHFGLYTAMLALLGEAVASHPMKLAEMTAVARQHGVPVIVDAAAERLTIPNVSPLAGGRRHGGVVSGGKAVLRGPQVRRIVARQEGLAASRLGQLPRRTGASGRALKVGKEEIKGDARRCRSLDYAGDHDAVNGNNG